MRILRRFGLIICFKAFMCICICPKHCLAQQKKTRRKAQVLPTLTPRSYTNPRPKFLEVHYEKIGAFPIQTRSSVFDPITSGVQTSNKISVKLNAPLLYKKDLQIIFGLRYNQERYRFLDTNPSDLPTHHKLNDRELRSLGYRIYINQNLNDAWRLKYGMAVDLSGDQINFSQFGQHLNHSYFFIVEKEVNDRASYSFGLAGGTDLGNFRIYPVFSWSQHLNHRWCLDLNLPKKVRINYMASPKMYFNANAKIAGASYYIQEPLFEGYEAVEFRQSRIQLTLGVEREIYDWLWFSMDAGMLKTLRMDFNEPQAPRSERLLRLKSISTPMVHFSIFMVPPRKLFSKHK